MADIQPYMHDAYTKEFSATITSVSEGKFVTLDTTFFYPTSGGQPHDTGTLTTADGRVVDVVFVGLFNGTPSHQVTPEGLLKKGDVVTGSIDWKRRYMHMRMHTAAHLVSKVFEERKGAVVTGNQLGTEKSRVDYELDEYNPDELRAFEDVVNEYIKQEHEVLSRVVFRSQAEQLLERLSTLKMGFPDNITQVRLVQIGDIDIQACGGTHLANTKEAGRVRFIKFDNKGKNNRRVYFTVE